MFDNYFSVTLLTTFVMINDGILYSRVNYYIQVPSADNVREQFGSKLFDTLMVFLTKFFRKKVDFEIIGREQKGM